MSREETIGRLDEAVDDFVKRTRIFSEDITLGRAQMFVLQHRQNTRYRNSVLKLRVATNCPVWDIKLGILEACSEEIIADHEYGDGRPHWKIVEDLGVDLGLEREAIVNSELLPSTRLSWLAWEALMSNRHWLEGLIANTCAERTNVPGYGVGEIRDKGWFGVDCSLHAEAGAAAATGTAPLPLQAVQRAPSLQALQALPSPARGRSPLRIYVYDMPSEYTTRLLQWSACRPCTAPSGFEAATPCIQAAAPRIQAAAPGI